MNKELTPLEALEYIKTLKDQLGTPIKEWLCAKTPLSIIEQELNEKEQVIFELEVFKLAYEWKCKGVEGTYEEVLEQARKTVKGWEQINKRGYGEVLLGD